MPLWSDGLGATVKSLGDGQVATSKGTIYTVPADTASVVMNVKMVNTTGGTVKVNLYYKASGGTSRRILPKDLEIAGGNLVVMDDEETMEAGDVLEADATIGSAIDYVVNGIQIV